MGPSRPREPCRTEGGEPRLRGLCLAYLGRILLQAGQPGAPLWPLAEAIRDFEAAGDEATLAAALGDKASSRRVLGRLTDALESAERSTALSRTLGYEWGKAAGHSLTAEILRDQHRYAEAEVRYGEGLKAAREAGDAGLEGIILQHLGILCSEQGQHARAVTLYKDALARFRATGNRPSEMRTADLLGTAEAQARPLPRGSRLVPSSPRPRPSVGRRARTRGHRP